jgi:ABC-2 type transport system permease protein
VMMIMAHFVFGYGLPAERLSYALCVVVGVVGFTGLGLAFALLVRTSSEAIAMSNIIYLPLSFLSGAYFPVDGLPGSAYLHLLPSAALIDALRISAQMPAAALLATTPFRLLVLWGIALIAVAFTLRGRLALDPRHL